MIEVPRCLPRLSVERLKNMNPLIRLCGLKRRHGEPICYTVQEIRNATAMRDPGRMGGLFVQGHQGVMLASQREA